MLQLRGRIESCLVALGLAPEGRKFAPHITQARLKNTPPVKVGRFLENHNLYFSRPWTVDELFLYFSRLGRNGAIHRIEAGYPLTFRPPDLREFATTPDRKSGAIPCREISPLPH